jgi:hypothetical protein
MQFKAAKARRSRFCAVIFEGLPARHGVDPVAHLGVSGDGADQRDH